MADAQKTIGSRGEAETVTFLETRGYQIVDTNVGPLGGTARGEIEHGQRDKEAGKMFLE